MQNIIRKYKTHKSVENRPRSGRPRKLSRRDVSLIIKEVTKNPKISAPKIADSIAAASGKSVHSKTVARALRENSYQSRVPRKKPLISEKNKQLRLEFANKYKDMDESFWRRVLFTDESKFNPFGSYGRRKIWRKTGTAYQTQNVIPTVKHGGRSVMVWGAMGAAGVGHLTFIDGIMNKYVYKSMCLCYLRGEKVGHERRCGMLLTRMRKYAGDSFISISPNTTYCVCYLLSIIYVKVIN